MSEWGPWIEHDGNGCPCAGEFVSAIFEECFYEASTGRVVKTIHTQVDGFIAGIKGGLSWDWSNWPLVSKIIRYRIRKPKGLLILEQVLREVERDPMLV